MDYAAKYSLTEEIKDLYVSIFAMFCSFNFFLVKNVMSKAVCELKFKMKFKLLFN